MMFEIQSEIVFEFELKFEFEKEMKQKIKRKREETLTGPPALNSAQQPFNPAWPIHSSTRALRPLTDLWDPPVGALQPARSTAL